MSFIKRLKIKGFKSFAKPTTLVFEPNFNTIIGANGSGKSNIFDALCFVLGRMSSKGLRTEKLGNLVFNGGKGGKACKTAEVDIYIDNSKREFVDDDIDEVKISRIIKAGGGSKYYFNNKPSTRSDILTLLSRVNINPDGYNIILQGDIQRIVNMTNNERRELIEEIADINIYEEKKQKSQKKLAQIEERLKEADLILDEKTKYITDLKSEKDLALKYYEAKDSLRFNSILLIKSKITRNNLLRKKKEENLDKNKTQVQEKKNQLEEFESKTQEIEDKILEFERKIERESQQEFIDINNQINNLENDVNNLTDKKNETSKNLISLKEKKGEITLNIKKSKEEIENLENKNKNLKLDIQTKEQEIEKFNTEIDKLRSRFNNSNVDKLNEIDKELEYLDEDRIELNSTKEDYNLKIERLNTKIAYIQEEISKIQGNQEENKNMFKELEEKRSKLKKLILDISNLANKDSENSARLGSLNQEYEEVLSKYTKIKGKAEQAQTQIANNRAVEDILKFKNRDEGIFGTVGELGSVDEKYSMALETVGGGNLFNIVVNDDTTGVKYINYLKNKKIGTATFLPLSKLKGRVKLDNSVIGKQGVIDYAVNLINYDEKFSPIFHLIYKDTLVIQSIDYAKSLGIGKYKMVTLDGDLVNKSGAMSGGYRVKKTSRGIFKNDKAIHQLEDISERLEILRESISHLKNEKTSNEQELYQKRQKKIEVEGEVVKLEKSLEIEGKDIDSLLKEKEYLNSDRKTLLESLKGIEEDIKKIEKEKAEFSKEKEEIKKTISMKDVVEKVSNLENQRDILKEKFLELKKEFDNSNIQINNILKPEVDNLSKNLENTKEFISKNEEFLINTTKDIKIKTEKLKALKKEGESMSKDYKKLIEQRDKLKEDKKKIDNKYNKIYEDFIKIKEEIARLNLQTQEYSNINKVLEEELELSFDELKTEFGENQEKFDNFLREIQNNLKENIDIKNLQNKVNALKAKMNSFGSINLKAVEIYDKLSQEYNELLKKRDSLNEDKKKIEELLAELEQKKKEIFLYTYNKIRDNFISIFKDLNSKGEADLILEDEENIFENGVQIRLKMSEKNFLDIKSLSGGEKTMTALAFIFSVQEFNPASFYIFDEVDAALDSWNAEKLGELVKKYSSKAQYIVVSHNENLIKSSDIIYGVTMDKNKISDVVSLKFDEVKDDMIENTNKN